MVRMHVSPLCRTRRRGPLVLGRQASFWVSAGVVAHTLWTSAAPAMTYRLYAEEWHLTHTVTTGIFAVYPIVVVTILIIFGDISDHVLRVVDHVESYDRLLSDILSAHLAQISVGQNDDMRKISAWIAIAAVPTMIAGIYGMNFDTIPELTASFTVGDSEYYYGYFVVLTLMASVCFGLYRAFKRSGWL